MDPYAFMDKANDVQWGSEFNGWVKLSSQSTFRKNLPFQCKFQLQEQGDSILFSFDGIRGDRIRDVDFKLEGKLVLTDQYLEIVISQLSSSFLLEDLEYPAHILTVKSGTEDGYIVAPHLQGVLYPSRYDAGFMRYGQNIWDMIADKEEWWSFESGSLNMPWFGASKSGSSVLVTMLTSSDAMLHLIGNSVVGEAGTTVNARQGQNPGTRLSSLTPIWQSSFKKLAYPRKMRIELVSGGYVGMAARYKTYAKGIGQVCDPETENREES